MLPAYEVTNPSTKLEAMELILAWLKTVKTFASFCFSSYWIWTSAVVRCCNKSFHLFFSLKCYVGTVHVLYDSIFNNVLGNLALRIYLCFLKKSLLLVWRANTWSCWTLGLLGSRSLRPELPFPDENHSLGVYFIKGWRGFYFSELSKYYIICTGKRQNYFSSAHATLFVYVIDINLVF